MFLNLLSYLTFCFWFILSIIKCNDQPNHQTQPNIIFFMADDLGWNDLSCHGDNQILTPNIDALGYNGNILNRHYVLPTCTPSRAAFLTGKYPMRFGIEGPTRAGKSIAVPTNETLLPQYLKQLNYSTHLIGKWHIGCASKDLLPHNRGYDYHFGFYNGYLMFNESIHLTPNGVGLDIWENGVPAVEETKNKYLTDVLTEKAINVIKSRDKTKPFYIQINHASPHAGGPSGHEIGLLQVRNVDENEKLFGHIADPSRRLLAGMLKSLDDSVGSIMETLESEDMLKNSIVVFISDNGGITIDRQGFMGTAGSNYPLRGLKASLYDGGVRGAAVMWSPMLKNSGTVSNNLIHVTDWLPTLYGLAGGDVSKLTNIDGINFWNSINEKTGKSDTTDKSDTTETKSNIRESMLVHFLTSVNMEGAIKNNYKLIKTNPKEMGFINFHYPNLDGIDKTIDWTKLENYTLESNQNKFVLSNYVKEIIDCKTNKVISKYQSKQLDEKVVESIKNEAKITCKHEKVTNEDCTSKYCLYDLKNDPCEYVDIANDNKQIVEEITKILNDFRKQMGKIQDADVDPKALPKTRNDMWTTWL